MIKKIIVVICILIIGHCFICDTYAEDEFIHCSRDDLLIKAQEHSVNGDYERAIQIYEYLLEQNPHDESVSTDLENEYRSLFNTYRYGNIQARYDIEQLKHYFKKEERAYRKYHLDALMQFYGFLILGMGILVLFDSFLYKNRGGQLINVTFDTRKMWINSLIVLLLAFSFIICRSFLWRAQANNSEFLFRGVLGKDLIDGLKAHFFYYRTSAHDGSTSFVGLLCAPLFFLFGDSFFSLYCVAILIPLMVLVLLYYFSARYFSTTAALIACFLFILAPFQYLVYTAFMLGFHTDSPFFTLLLLLIFFNVFFTTPMADVYYGLNDLKSKRRKLYFLFAIAGLISGFATYVCYTFVLSLFIFLFFWFIVDHHCLKRRYFYIFGICFLISFSPWLLFNIRDNFSGFYIPIYKQDRKALLSFDLFFKKGSNWFVTLQCLKKSLLHIFYSQPFFRISDYNIPRFVPRYLFCNILFVSLFVSFISSIKSFMKFVHVRYIQKSTHFSSANIHLKEVMIFSYIVLIILMFCLHPSLWPSQNYLHPAYPFILLLVGLLINKLRKVKFSFIRLRAVAFVLVIFIVLSGFNFCQNSLYQFTRFDIGSFKDMFRMKGYSLAHLPYFLIKALHKNNVLFSDLQMGFAYEGKMFNAFHAALGAWIDSESHHLNNWDDVDKRYEELENLDPPLRPFLYIRLGMTIGDGVHRDTISELPIHIKTYIDEEYHHCVYQGIAISYGNRQYSEIMNDFESDFIDSYIPQEYRHYFYIEYGRRIGERFRGNFIAGIEFLEKCNNNYYPFLYLGFISSFSHREIIDIINTEIDIHPLFKTYASFFYGKDFYEIDRRDYKRDVRHYVNKVAPRYLPYCLFGIVYGISEQGYHNLGDSEYFDPIHMMRIIKERIFKDKSIDASFHVYVYEGLGLSLSLKSMGNLSSDDYHVIDDIIPHAYVSAFYRGYGIGLALRYGCDENKIIQLIKKSVPLQYHDIVKKSAQSGFDDIKNKI